MSDVSGSPSVLCVQSNGEDALLLRAYLRDYEVVLASTALKALQKLQAGYFHAFILDHYVSDCSGAQLCREVRKIDPHAPIVFCTSAARQTDRADAMRAGANEYLVKPIEPTLLRSKLHTLLAISALNTIAANSEQRHAIRDELERRWEDVKAYLERPNALLTSALERAVKLRAYEVFVNAGGSRAHFEEAWPGVFQQALEDYRK